VRHLYETLHTSGEEQRFSLRTDTSGAGRRPSLDHRGGGFLAMATMSATLSMGGGGGAASVMSLTMTALSLGWT
jgi:hypothetical protein